MDAREMRGIEIARTSRIRRNEREWTVPSQSGRGKYRVWENGHGYLCSCPDCQFRRQKCKHIWAVEYWSTRRIDMNGNETRESGMRVTYSQDWSAYNRAQTHEGQLFMKLLSNLCSNTEQPEYKFGRPALSLGEMVFSSALKVYSTFSLRRFVSLMRTARKEGCIDKVCSYSTVSNYMRKPEMTKVLQKLIQLSSLPLASIETKFAVDSSGFSTCRFARYYSFKHGRDMKYKKWIKAHIISGTKTNVITGVEITGETKNDSPYFKPLVKRTASNFQINEVYADKAYSSRENHEIVGEAGGTAYIPFRKNATGRAGRSALWKKMYHYFQYNREEFLQHYHKRSNSETVFHMIKTKFKDSVRSKDKVSQVNEVLLKVLCHNICVVIQEVHELGAFPNS